MQIPRAELKIPDNRQRRDIEPGALLDLATSISKFGLFHPPVVRAVNGEYWLVAGERRLRAMEELHEAKIAFTCNGTPVALDCVPVTLLSELAEADLFEAELEENVRRVDLDWKDVIAARARLHELRSQKDKTHTTSDTAEEIFGRRDAAGVIVDALVLNDHLADPNVKAAKSAREALRIVEKKLRSEENERRAEQLQKIESPHKVFHANWLEHNPGDIPLMSVLLTDPPYGMNADLFGDSAGLTGGAHTYADDDATFQNVTIPGLVKASAVCSTSAHAYVFCDFDRFHALRTLFQSLEWYVFRTPLIWVRKTGRVPIPDYGPRRNYECILFARRGDRKVNIISSDVISAETDENLDHPAQKPVALLQELLRRSVRPGEWVLDPFAGSGSLLPAAHAERCRAYLIEQDLANIGIITKRLNELPKG